MKFLLGFLLSFSAFAATTYSGRVNLSPVSAIIEQKVGSSLEIFTTGGSSLAGASLISVSPQVWVTNTGSSTTSYAASPPSVGPGMRVYISGNSGQWGSGSSIGGSLTLPMSFVFHAPSIWPAYGNSLQVGTQTYSVGAIVQFSDGTTFYPTAGTVKVLPLPLPDSQVSGWH